MPWNISFKWSTASGSGNENVVLPWLRKVRVSFSKICINCHLRLGRYREYRANAIPDKMKCYIISHSNMMKYLYHLQFKKTYWWQCCKDAQNTKYLLNNKHILREVYNVHGYICPGSLHWKHQHPWYHQRIIILLFRWILWIRLCFSHICEPWNYFYNLTFI